MDNIKLNELDILTFNNFKKYGVTTGFTTRHGGVSTGYSSSLNFDYNKGDNKENVIENYEILARALNTTRDNFVYGFQKHTDVVLSVGNRDGGMKYPDTDGFVTDESVVLLTFHADCAPIYLFDTVKRVIGMVHSGWEGTTKNITKSAIDKMVENYGTNPADIIVGVGASICQNCFEVDKDVADIFKEKGYEEFIQYRVLEKKYHIDIKKIIKKQCEDEGVLSENIELTDVCTMCDEQKRFFSHRKMGLKRGGHVAFIKIESE